MDWWNAKEAFDAVLLHKKAPDRGTEVIARAIMAERKALHSAVRHALLRRRDFSFLTGDLALGVVDKAIRKRGEG